MSSAEKSVEQELSKVIFGGKRRLMMLTEICRTDEIVVSELADEMKCARETVTRELIRYTEVGVLIRSSRIDVTEPFIYTKNPDIDWDVVESALGEAWKLAESTAASAD
jgi:hypothetical protein